METFDWDALDGQERTQAEDDELAQGEAQLRALLLRARPKWSSRELEAALRKLQMVSVASVAQLAEVLLLPKVAVSVSPKLELDELEEEVLNVKLQEVGCKAFSREALASLRQELDTRDVGAMDALEVTDTEVTETEMGDAGGDLFEQEAIDFVVVFERVALRASMALDGEVVGVLTRGRVLRGVPQQDAGRPWVKVKLQEVNGGPVAVREWQVVAPGAGLELADTKPKRVKELSLGSVLHGHMEQHWLKTRQGKAKRHDSSGREFFRCLPERFGWILVNGEHLGLGALLQPLSVDDGFLRRLPDRGLGLFATQEYEEGDCVLEERPFFRRHGVAQLKGHQKFFTKSFRAKFEQIKAPFTMPGDEAQSHVYASPAMLRSAVSFCSASLMTQQMILELHHPPLSSSHPLVSVALAVAKLCRSAVPCCHEISEEVLQLTPGGPGFLPGAGDQREL
ncbi:unnamed protein product [Durusdinium trenchii]|uniref:Uncharacterized protein n=1 Tax=Durusdinium trenchii TaxID=1381693 RepID=A0ABP0I2K5_9DINO